ncbi:LacI family DNA-binding transcriptional regulator [Streptomyces litchfieldiae]|uniref:LacI family DNA-binding transcriptional regulator n=1 Tax=Streptomyces litchfieldiae TaxID=3075543 RepID=A0ABU2MPF5_9ACTN|nr:LacI family DNA-binding transcriptional regulator [Streptomyces sp. DSM 44938]MDT0343496.1 LacI family DNA-binding transcriptional regulator [Streptomyces sp. DSM 44938]
MTGITDVARHAGVAVSTVSYVISGKRSISPPTRRRVLDSIAVLGYRPPSAARSRTLGLAVRVDDGTHRPLLAEFMLSASVAARRYDRNVLLLTDEHEHSILDAALLDGLILMDVGVLDPRLDTVRGLPVPTVLLGLPRDPAGLRCVDLDFRAAGRLCVDHLAELGHREIVLLGAPGAACRRRAGFAERTAAGAAERAAARGVRLTHRPCEGDWDNTAGTLTRVLQERPETTAIIVQNEAATPHLAPLLRGFGRAIPEDLSLVAVGSDAVATAGSPLLTSVSVPAAEMTARAVELLMDEPGRAGERTVLLAPRLTARASTAPPRSH